MKEKTGNLIFVAGLLLVLFLLINLVHLIWYIADPEGFWGFTYFLELLRVGIFVIVIAAFAIILIILLISSLMASFRNGFKGREFLKGLGILVFLLTVPLVNYLLSNGPFLYITGSLANKYSHLETTQRYLNRGELLKACDYAEKAYEKELDRGEISSFFFLSQWYSQTDLDKSQRLTSRFAAIIAYGLCLKESSGAEEEAEVLFQEAVKISDSELLQAEKASFLSFPLMALAEIHLQRGTYYEAEAYFERLEDFHNELNSEDIRYQIQGRMFFADRAIRVGDFKKAAEIHLENVGLYERSSADESSQFYLALLLMSAISETHLENYRQAQQLLQKAAPVAKKHKDNLFYPNFLLAKADFIYRAALNDLDVSGLISRSWWEKITGSFGEKKSVEEELLEEAETLYQSAVRKTLKKAGRNSLAYLNNLQKLGEFYYNTGRHEEADEVFWEAEKILRPVKNENPDVYNNILLATLRTKEKVDYSLISQVEDQIFRRISSNYLFLTEEEKESFIGKIRNQLHVPNSIYAMENSPEANKRLYNNILATKQLALNSSKHLREFISNAPEELKQEYATLLKEKEKLLNTSSEEKRRRLGSEVSDKERKLHTRISAQMSFSPFDPRETDWMEVKNSLGPEEAAIEMFRIPVRHNLVQKEEDHYFALVLKKESDHPILVPLFKEKKLEEILNKAGGIQERVNTVYGTGKEELLELIWDPLSGGVSGSSTIYIAVSGILHHISFPALMLDQPAEFRLLGTTRDVSKVKSSQPETKKKVALFGDADFNSINKDGGSRSFHTVDEQVKQGLETGDFPNLQYTRHEINSIEKILTPTAEMLTKFAGKEASEQSFRNLYPGNYNIIHLATHGFYFNASAPVLSQGPGIIGGNSGMDNPMFRSGLLLSASTAPRESRESDGILTAFEISKMDFSGVDLMVLSACETGRGDISGGEGVFGLQRALKLAGVKEQIVSLWQVPDQQTAELFEIFYEVYSLGHSVHRSLKMAQTEMAKKYEPFYWAGFVLLE